MLVVIHKGGSDLLDTLGDWQDTNNWSVIFLKWKLDAQFNGNICSTTGITCGGQDGLDIYLEVNGLGLGGALDDLIDVGSYRIVSV